MGKRDGFKRAARSPLYAGLAAWALLGLWACGTDSGDDLEDPQPTVKIETPVNGSTVTAGKVLLRVSTTHFTYKSLPLGKTSAAQHGGVEGGHIHVFLDRPAGLDANAITDLTRADTVTLNITDAGPHYIIVAGADANHDDVEGMQDSVGFTVALP